MGNKKLRTWIEVDKAAVAKNYGVFRKVIGDSCKLMAVAKSNAYGHSLIDFSRLVSSLGADWIGVDSVLEALALRREGIKKPILVLGYTLPENFKDAAENRISLTISTIGNLKKAALLRKPLLVHLKIDTGMHRQGFFTDELNRVVPYFEKGSRLILEGVYTHFAAAKNPAFPKYTEGQIDEFLKATGFFEVRGFKFLKHAAATSGTLLFPESHFDMVRVGIGLYGLWPSPETRTYCKGRMKLEPALAWKTIIGEIKNLPRGARVGYDLIEKMDNPSKIAVLPVGYWHGYPRVLSGIGHAIVNGVRAKVIGRVSMDMIVVDISKVKNARVGDEAILIGGNATAEEMAALSETTHYEIITRLNPLIKRVYK
jgi:alanine racemase